ncbi:phage terminase large subunit family protein [Brevundimonas vancanneytii]|uniref:Bacteriophage tail assembly protein n=1 Tax=Brevundimonas vancanneytii TaxID=1325724 RepID=A0A4P1JTM1_9CAUL|nr:terminase gpA endonuclease subunit [Brevundimonas vancanneytii]VTO10673.1 Bacteriophage tail assembly protein [Brevundimonas vancanneytii]
MNAAVRFDGYAGAILAANAVRVDRSLAQGLRPPPRISVSDWSAQHRHFSDDSPVPGPFRNEKAPYLVEPMDRLSPHDPCSEVTIIKCAQSGGSVTGENWIGYIADVAPGPMMYVGPTISAAKDWLAEKFWPMVEASPRLSPDRRDGVVMPKRSRDGQGTTALRVRFRKGGWMLIAGANSAATLRQHSIRYVIEDDLDQFPDDLDNQGSPESMITARLTVFTRQGIAKRLKISTPTNKGASKSERAYGESDQRRYYLKCQHCGDRFDLVFADLKWPDGEPAKAHLEAPCCGVVIQHWEKEAMSLPDGWLPTVEIDGQRPARVLSEEDFQRLRGRDVQGRNPGYCITGIISAFLTWADLCAGFVAAQGDVNRLRSWTNLMLGESFVLKGDAPPAESLAVLREQEWGKGQVPWGPLVFTLGCDVQGDGIYLEALGWAAGLENWSLDHRFLPGTTDVPGQGAWALLEAYAQQTFTLPGGKSFGFDMICVDAGYNTDSTKAFCRRSPKRIPVYGRPGWTLPILGRGQPIHFHPGKGQKARRRKVAGEEAHLVGTYGAKLSWFGFLRASIEQAEAEQRGERPEAIKGRVHFGRDATDDYFDQLTSESVVVKMKSGQPTRVWEVESGRQNHWLDCRIYNRAAAEAMALDLKSDADWLALAAFRNASPDPAQGDLIALANRPVPAASSSPEGERPPEPSALAAASASADAPGRSPAAGDDDWIDDNAGWLD